MVEKYADGTRQIVMRPGDPVPDQTSGKADAAGAGAAIGGLLTAVVSGAIIKVTGADMSPEMHANVLILCTLVGGAIAARLAAYYKKNFLK